MNINLLGVGQPLDSALNLTVAEFAVTSEELPLFRSLATENTLIEHSGRSYSMNEYGTVTAFGLTDGVDLTLAQTISDTQTQFTPNEVGLKMVIPKTSVRRNADPGYFATAGNVMWTALRSKIDRDGADQLSSFTLTGGGATRQLTASSIAAQLARLRIGDKRRTASNAVTAEPVPEPIVGVFHMYSILELTGNLVPYTDVPTGTNNFDMDANGTGDTVGAGRTGGFSDEIIKGGYKVAKMIGGVPLFNSGNISVDGDDDAVGAIFSKQGLRYINEWNPEMEVNWDASLRAWELVITTSYTFGIYKPLVFGVAMTNDAATPTA